jgi:hypothetical protein
MRFKATWPTNYHQALTDLNNLCLHHYDVVLVLQFKGLTFSSGSTTHCNSVRTMCLLQTSGLPYHQFPQSRPEASWASLSASQPMCLGHRDGMTTSAHYDTTQPASGPPRRGDRGNEGPAAAEVAILETTQGSETPQFRTPTTTLESRLQWNGFKTSIARLSLG